MSNPTSSQGPVVRHRSRLTRPLACFLALAWGVVSATYSDDDAMTEVTAQLQQVKGGARPLSGAQLAALLPGRCAGAGPSARKQVSGHAEASYGRTQVLIDDFAADPLGPFVNAGVQFGLHAGVPDSALLRPVKGAIGYSAFEPAKALAQTRVWMAGRFVVQVIQTSARSRAEVEACLASVRLAALPGLAAVHP